MRPSRRQPDELRAVSLERGVVKYAEGSCFVKFGDTHVLVTATLEDRLPPWLKGQARGWVTAEYGMLPRATHERTRREASAGKQSGRTVEIQRLIGRSLRSVVDLPALGERQITIDCDVIQADGGTRTASITGAWVALHDCLAWMKTREMIKANPLRDHVAAISCGVFNGTAVLDLDYAEDSEAETDANFVMTGAGNIVEVQATAEKTPFSEEQLLALLGARPQGHRQAGRSAEDGGDVRHGASPDRRPARDRDPQSGQARRDARTAGGLRRRRHIGGRARACRAGGNRHDLPRQRAHQGGGRGQGVGHAGLRRRFRARGRCARRRARHPLGALGRAGQGFSSRDEQDSKPADRARRQDARSAAAAHFVSALCVAWPDGHVEEFEATVDGTVVWPPRGDQGFGYDPMFLPDGQTRTFGEMPSEEKHGLPPRGRGLSHRARAFLKLAEACLGKALTQTRALRRLRALAVLPVEVPVLRLQQPRPPRRDRRAALPARVPDRDRRDRGARARPHRVDASSSAAARRR